ncbi:MAG: DUF4433 domain-containing protein [Phycisphaerae bacterium]|nr:DUF4433 domain-containing protein [Phycisphaerae bacterium]
MALSPPADVLNHTPIYRMVHTDCLDTLLCREALHAPNHAPDDGLPYTGIHAVQTQLDRGNLPVPCGPGGVILDYVGFYFGPRSPMLYRLHTGYNVARVDQSQIIYLVSTAQAVADAGLGFVFTDRHSLAAVAAFRDNLGDLAIVDFPIAYATQWNTTPQHLDRQEKKQAEFLVYRSVPWQLIDKIGVRSDAARERVTQILEGRPAVRHPPIIVERSWYY